MLTGLKWPLTAIDNYLIDPLALTLLYLEEPNEREKIGFDKHDSIVGFSKKTEAERQQYIDNVISLLEDNVPDLEKSDKTSVDYTILDGSVYHVPSWFMKIKGHDLVGYLRLSAPFLNKYKDNDLFKKIIETCYNNYPELIPMDIVDTMRELQEIKWRLNFSILSPTPEKVTAQTACNQAATA